MSLGLAATHRRKRSPHHPQFTGHLAVVSSATDRSLDHHHLAAIRQARLALLETVRRGPEGEVDGAIASFVRTTWAADFSRLTICSLVAAAVDAGLPVVRGVTRRAQREASLDRWTRLAGSLVDDLAGR